MPKPPLPIGPHRSPRLRRRRGHHVRGQELVEFTILITFFLILFFCVIQVCLTAIDKFKLAHMGLYSARSWSVFPTLTDDDTMSINEVLIYVKGKEMLKKQLTGRTMTEGDRYRRNYLWAAHSSLLGTVPFIGKPPWTEGIEPELEGPIYIQPLPMRMPYSSLVMGGRLSLNLQQYLPDQLNQILNLLNSIGSGFSIPNLNFNIAKVGGFEVTIGRTFVPMDKEPEEDPEEFDNDRDLETLEALLPADVGDLF